jgi:hypothetical protein
MTRSITSMITVNIPSIPLPISISDAIKFSFMILSFPVLGGCYLPKHCRNKVDDHTAGNDRGDLT